jgi:hypothetical protein
MSRNQYYALGRRKLPGQMNKTEAAYAVELENLKHAGAILWSKFEGIKLRLADNTFFNVDFAVMTSGLELQMHEVKPRKGDTYYTEDDAKMKVKIAADQYPFRFFIKWPLKGGGWGSEEL